MTDASNSHGGKTPAVLFVCLGNICRSPTGEAVLRRRAGEAGLALEIDSAGTSAWHIGEPPDPRSVEHGMARGYSFDGQAARAFDRGDFACFDYILAMDSQNLSALKTLCPPSYSGHLGLLLDFASGHEGRDVPDPYYGGAKGFDDVIDLVERACAGLMGRIQR